MTSRDKLRKKAEHAIRSAVICGHEFDSQALLVAIEETLLSVQSAQREEDASTIEHTCHCPHCEARAKEIRAQGEKP